MSTIEQTDPTARRPRTVRLAGWGLVVGGALFFVGGSLHPGEDPPDVTLKEHLLIMYRDSSWYPSHALLLAGMTFFAASLVALVRGRAFADGRARMHVATKIAAIATVLGTISTLLHLVSATEADEIAAGQGTPITDANLLMESLAVPVFGLAITALAVVGAATRTLGNYVTALLAVAGGIAYALAAGTALLTDTLNFLFPLAAGIALWAAAAGIGLLIRSRAHAVVPSTAA